MNKLALPLALAVFLYSCFAPCAQAEDDKTWYITPRYGFSTSTGMLGVEVQVDHFALSAGAAPMLLMGCDSIGTYAIKYYFNSTGDSWSLNLFSASMCTRLSGIGADYRWRWTHWDVTAGLGLGSDGTVTGVVPSFAFGYAF